MAGHETNGNHAAGRDLHITNIGSDTETLPDDCVFIAGGGPVGMLVAITLAYYGVKSVLLERNLDTTKWPKMDYTNVRSMEMFRRLGLAEKLREQGVPTNVRNLVNFSSGMGQNRILAQWLLPSVDEDRELLKTQNDGTLPLESGVRISQVTLEAWLKEQCDQNPLTDVRFGWKVESAQETETGAIIEASDVATGNKRTLIARYAVGCDGASSRVRKSLGIPLVGGPVPGYNLLVHFKSDELERLDKFGKFYHHFSINKAGFMGIIIAQDRPGIFTAHLLLPLDVDSETIDSHEAVYTVLGGSGERYPIKIDEILVRSTYRPNIVVASQYAGPKRHIFIAGDAAHQNLPTGGYGMNMGLIDAVNIGWKLAAIINGFGGSQLLESFEQERRPVALISVERSGVHMNVHMSVKDVIGPDAEFLNSDDERGVEVRRRIAKHYENDAEGNDYGVIMGYIYRSGIVIPDESSPELEFTPARYIPSTCPGHRAPHVFLKNSHAIYDLYGDYFTLVDFTPLRGECGATHLMMAASDLSMPIKHLQLPDEEHAASLWEKQLVLVRPDGHVSWRGSSVESKEVALKILSVVAGFVSPAQSTNPASRANMAQDGFTGTVGLGKQDKNYELEKVGDFQK